MAASALSWKPSRPVATITLTATARPRLSPRMSATSSPAKPKAFSPRKCSRRPTPASAAASRTMFCPACCRCLDTRTRPARCTSTQRTPTPCCSSTPAKSATPSAAASSATKPSCTSSRTSRAAAPACTNLSTAAPRASTPCCAPPRISCSMPCANTTKGLATWRIRKRYERSTDPTPAGRSAGKAHAHGLFHRRQRHHARSHQDCLSPREHQRHHLRRRRRCARAVRAESARRGDHRRHHARSGRLLRLHANQAASRVWLHPGHPDVWRGQQNRCGQGHRGESRRIDPQAVSAAGTDRTREEFAGTQGNCSARGRAPRRRQFAQRLVCARSATAAPRGNSRSAGLRHAAQHPGNEARRIRLAPRPSRSVYAQARASRAPISQFPRHDRESRHRQAAHRNRAPRAPHQKTPNRAPNRAPIQPSPRRTRPQPNHDGIIWTLKAWKADGDFSPARKCWVHRFSPFAPNPKQVHIHTKHPSQTRRTSMRGFVWLALAVLLFCIWIGSFLLYHVAGFFIHLLLIFAVISLILHLFSRKRPA